MKLYHVEYADYFYDEHDAAIIAAKSPAQAELIASKELRNVARKSPTVEYIGDSYIEKEGVILASFNAG